MIHMIYSVIKTGHIVWRCIFFPEIKQTDNVSIHHTPSRGHHLRCQEVPTLPQKIRHHIDQNKRRKQLRRGHTHPTKTHGIRIQDPLQC